MNFVRTWSVAPCEGAFVSPFVIGLALLAVAMEDGEVTHWQPELRRALIAVRPEYFGWPNDERLRYRVQLPNEDREAIIAALLKSHGHRRPAATAKLEARGRVPLELQNEVNEWLQPLVGIGEDTFKLNECFPEGRSILDFPTLLSYDQDDHCFQEDARERDDSKHVRRPYAGALHSTWARCLIDGRLCYLTLSMAAWHLYASMQEAAADEIQRLLPHSYVAGPDDGKVERGLIRWDSRLQAGGQEALLEELRRRVWAFEARRCDELLVEFKDRRMGATFLVDDPYAERAKDETNLLVVFSDPEALAQVRFTSFLRDTKALERPREELKAFEDREAQTILRYANEQHDELLQTFDPQVLPLRRRRKVMMHPEALRDLDNSGES